MKGLLLNACVLLMSMSGFAQAIGFEAGISMGNMRFNVDGAESAVNFKLGGRVGIVREEFLGDHFSTQYGAFYNAKGSRLRYTKTQSDGHVTTVQDINGFVRVDYVEAPLSVLYHSNANRRNGFFIGGGAYLGAAFGGLLSINNNFTHINGVTYTIRKKYLMPAKIGETETSDFSLLDVGLQLQGGYEFPNGLYTRLQCSYGLVDIDPSAAMSMKNQSIALTVGYMVRR